MSVPNPSREIQGSLTVRDAEELLVEWANVPGPWPFRWSLTPTNEDKQAAARFAHSQKLIQRRHMKLLGFSGKDAWKGMIVGNLHVREMLRRAWDSPDPREREWLCFRIRDSYAAMVRRAEMTPDEMIADEENVAGPRYAAPPVTPFEAVIYHFQRQGKRARHCPGAECLAPYFVAKKKNQRYCSPECARPARLESQRLWWSEHGEAATKRRKK